jgi:hypothetical protein
MVQQRERRAVELAWTLHGDPDAEAAEPARSDLLGDRGHSSGPVGSGGSGAGWSLIQT